jgi:hypothetical protein
MSGRVVHLHSDIVLSTLIVREKKIKIRYKERQMNAMDRFQDKFQC